MDSKPSSFRVSIILFILRVLTFVFLLIALILLATNDYTVDYTVGSVELKFNDVYAYRYMISTIAVGFAYNLVQMAVSIFTLVSGKSALSGDVGYLLDFFGDKIISYLLLSGSAAGFGASIELQRISVTLNSFFGKANASASLLLIGFLFTAIGSTLTSFALPKKP